MSIELPNENNQANFVLEVEPTTQASPAVDMTGIRESISFEDAVIKPYSTPANPGYAKVETPLNEKIIVWDTETTGTNPWEYRLIVISCWDLSKPISTMETFASFDEEELTNQFAEYLNREKPSAMVCYNNGFDQRAVLSRFMLYQTKVPGWNQIKQIDMMEILKKGTTQSIASSQPTGSEEQWFFYFFGEKKPYTIEECFEGVRNNDLTPMIIRNRTCTASEGWLYLLFREMTDSVELEVVEDRPTLTDLDEAKEKGICVVQCPACEALNTVPCTSKDNTCYRCSGNIPDPTDKNVMKEKVRPYDFSTVGLKETKAK